MTQALEAIQKPQDYFPEEQRKAVNQDLAEIQEKAKSLRVVNDESLEEANTACNKATQRKKGINQFRLAIVKPFKDHLANIDAFFNGLAGEFDAPLETLTKKATDYREKKIRAAREEQEKLEREAREKEEREREKIRKEQEAARLKEEEARKAGKQAEADALAKKQEELKKQESEVKVEVKEAKKVEPPKTAYTAGIGRTTYIKDSEHRIENPDLVPDEFWIIDEKKLNARRKELTKSLEVGKVYRELIPGVVITCTERPSFAGEK